MKNESVNIKSLEPISGAYGFNQLSKMSDMGSVTKLSKQIFEKLVKLLEKSGADIFTDDQDKMYTVFSYGDNYNLVKLKEGINESINESGEFDIAQKLFKKAGGKEIKFYDELEILHDKLGHPKFMLWLSAVLKSKGVNMYKDPKIKNPQEAEEYLYNLLKTK